MVYITAFVLGALAIPLVPHNLVWPPALLALVTVASAIAGVAFRRKGISNLPWANTFFSCSCVCLGAAMAATGVDRLVEAQLAEAWHGRDLTLKGTVEEVIDSSSTSFSRFHFRVDEVQPQAVAEALHRRKVRLSWYYGSAVEAGQEWELRVRLKRPRGFVNPRGFDYGAWLLAQDLVATGYIKEGRRLPGVSAKPALQEVRHQLAELLFRRERFSNAFFQALLLGDKNAIAGEQWRVLKRTGTIHLMAISGLHVGLVAGLGFILGWLMCRALTVVTSPRLSLWLSRLLPPLISCVSATGYSALAGFSIPTQRAMILVAFANLALLMGLRPNPLRLLALACVLVLAASPLAATQSGFWLSFAAVMVLIIGFGGRQLRLHPVFSLVKAQWLLAIGLLAPLLALGQTVSVVAPVANLVAVPLVSLVIVPGLLLSSVLAFAIPAAGDLLLTILDESFRLLWRCLAAMSEIGGAQWWPSFPTTNGMIAVVTCAALLIILPRGLYLRGLGILVLGIALAAPRPPAPALTVTVLEVGQGLAVWLHTPGYNLLYDTGPAFSADFDAGSRIVVPFLQTRGVQKLNMLMISHGDTDHSGGLQGVLREMPAERVLVGDAARSDPEGHFDLCQQGQHWRRGEVDFTVLWPSPQSHDTRNDNSCVLLVELGAQRILFTGDIEAGVERKLQADGLLPNKISLLIAPHHGSKTSSTRGFVDHTEPQSVVFSAGYQNRYGHPHPDVVERYREYGTNIYNTGEDGAVTFRWESARAEPLIVLARHASNRAWY